MQLIAWLFGCSHPRLSWPQISKRSRWGKRPYQCCTDCGKEFEYEGALRTLSFAGVSTDGDVLASRAGETKIAPLLPVMEGRHVNRSRGV